MDLIDRRAAIDALAKFVPYAICDESTESYTNGLTDAYNLICQLPSVEPKKGRWMHHEDKAYAGDGYEECSCCKWRCADWVFIEDSNYCPNCGAKMEGGEADG